MTVSSGTRPSDEPVQNEPGSDETIIARVLAGDLASFEAIMRKYNQRLFRAARAIVRDDAEAEDIVQEAYLRAYAHLGQFRGTAKFVTWLTRIAINEALARVRSRQRDVELTGAAVTLRPTAHVETPEVRAQSQEIRCAMEAAVARLPEAFRSVFVLRQVEGLSTEETAECLEIPVETVKTRLYRSRQRLQRDLLRELDTPASDLFSFGSTRCDRLVARVLDRLAAPNFESAEAKT